MSYCVSSWSLQSVSYWSAMSSYLSPFKRTDIAFRIREVKKENVSNLCTDYTSVDLWHEEKILFGNERDKHKLNSRMLPLLSDISSSWCLHVSYDVPFLNHDITQLCQSNYIDHLFLNNAWLELRSEVTVVGNMHSLYSLSFKKVINYHCSVMSVWTIIIVLNCVRNSANMAMQ